MNAFDKVIGYETIKNELMQICDMLNNRTVYEKMGAKMPQGILLYGKPGLGKTLMANCFIENSGLVTYTVRKNKGNNNFIEHIAEAFEKAKKTAPAIVFLDDMDKFANEDECHCDAEEYVAVQSGIDEVKECDVFVLATVNDISKLPKSLRRSGRFDRKIEVNSPTDKDAIDIIVYYLKNKNVSANLNMDNLVKMIRYNSCAELETVLNEAAIAAAYSRKQCIEMEDLVKVVLRMQYDISDNCSDIYAEKLRKAALHEAGHLVASEVLYPESVGFAAVCVSESGWARGVVHKCKNLPYDYYGAIISLAGKAAVEMYYSEMVNDGCASDIGNACEFFSNSMTNEASLGMALVGVETDETMAMSEELKAKSEAAIHTELERYLVKARNVLLKNREFLEKTAMVLAEKKTLLYSDIKAIRESVNIVNVAV